MSKTYKTSAEVRAAIRSLKAQAAALRRTYVEERMNVLIAEWNDVVSRLKDLKPPPDLSQRVVIEETAPETEKKTAVSGVEVH
jgi:hypothetical protein